MDNEEKRKPRLVTAENEVSIPVQQPPPSPPHYELVDRWDGPEERQSRPPTRLLAIAALVITALIITPLILRPPTVPTAVVSTITELRTTRITNNIVHTTTIYRYISVNATNVVLGSWIEIKGKITVEQTPIKAEIRVMEGAKTIKNYTLAVNGSFRIPLQLTGLTPGVYKLTLALNNDTIYPADLRILEPILRISAAETKVNHNITVFGFNFNITQNITICIVANKDKQCDGFKYNATADRNGFFNLSLKVPEMPKGNYTLIAFDGLNKASANFTVKPHLSLNSSFMQNTHGLKISGYGFEANKSLTVMICQQGGIYVDKEVRSNENGSFSLDIAYQELQPCGPGQYLIKIKQDESVDGVSFVVM
ncbi:MAG: hypothetical protein QXO30_01880 [Candidatus Caldarchaeum sp.]